MFRFLLTKYRYQISASLLLLVLLALLLENCKQQKNLLKFNCILLLFKHFRNKVMLSFLLLSSNCYKSQSVLLINVKK